MPMTNSTGVPSDSGGSGGPDAPRLLTGFYALVGAAGILGNGLVLIVLIAIKDLHTVTNLFIANQSMVDLVSSIFLLILFIAPMPALPEERLAATVVCVLWNFRYIFWGSVVTSTFNLVLITLERYFAVIHPVVYRRNFTFRRAIIMVAVVWVMGYGFQTYSVAMIEYSEADNDCTVNFVGKAQKAFIGCLVFVVEYLIPMIVMAFVYASIHKSLRQRVGSNITVTASSSGENRSTATEAEVPGRSHQPDETRSVLPGDRGLEESHQPSEIQTIPPDNRGQEGSCGVVNNYRVRARRNVIKTFLIVCVTYFICWTPNHVTFLWFFLGGDLDFDSKLYFFTVILAFLNMCVNPFIYTFKYHKFQVGLRKAFGMRQQAMEDISLQT